MVDQSEGFYLSENYFNEKNSVTKTCKDEIFLVVYEIVYGNSSPDMFMAIKHYFINSGMHRQIEDNKYNMYCNFRDHF